MAGNDLIQEYISELDGSMKLPRRKQARILAEVTDHLESHSERLQAQGVGADRAGEAAITAFGSSGSVALGFVENEAGTMTRSAVTWMAASAAMFTFFVLAGMNSGSPGSGFSRGFAGAVSFFTVQIAMTCGAITIIRVVRHRCDPSIPVAKLGYILRGAGVCLCVVLVTVLADLSSLLAGSHSGSDLVSKLLIVTAVGLGAVSVAGLVSILRAWHQIRGIVKLVGPRSAPSQSVFDDLAVVARPATRRIVAAVPVSARLLAGSSPVRHPWRFAFLVALAAGAGVALSHLISEGGAAVPVVLLVSAIFIGIEGVAVLICFVVFGRYLGLLGTPERTPGQVI